MWQSILETEHLHMMFSIVFKHFNFDYFMKFTFVFYNVLNAICG